MNTTAEGLLDATLRRSPAYPFFLWKSSSRLAVLAYHGVDDPERFERQLDYIRTTANPVTLSETLAAFEGRGRLPRRAVLITFDDGHRSVLEVGLPLLRERGLPAVAFVVAGLIDTDRPFWWSEVIDLAGRGGAVAGAAPMAPSDLARSLKRVPDERRRAAIDELLKTAEGSATPAPQLSSDDLRALESGGVEIGNHTWSHPCLSRCGDESCRTEIEKAHRMLSNVLGHPPVVFAYPDGDHDERAAGVLRELGYQAAFLFDHRLSPVSPRDHFAVSRLRVNSTTTLDRFRMIASGLHPTLLRVRGGV